MDIQILLFSILISFGFNSILHASGICQNYTQVSNEEQQQIYLGCEGRACPNLECKEMGTQTYMRVRSANLRGSKFDSFGYSPKLTYAIESNLTGCTFNSIASSNFSNSDLRGAIINEIVSPTKDSVNFSGADLRGTLIRNVNNIDVLILSGALFDLSSKFPFSEAEAIQKGMIKK